MLSTVCDQVMKLGGCSHQRNKRARTHFICGRMTTEVDIEYWKEIEDHQRTTGTQNKIPSLIWDFNVSVTHMHTNMSDYQLFWSAFAE